MFHIVEFLYKLKLSMRDFSLICMYLLLLPVVAGHSNYTILEKLEIMTKQIELDSYPIRVRDEHLYYLWGQCAHSPRLEKLKALKDLSQKLAHKSYVVSTIDMVALILTKSHKGPALMRLIVDDTSSIDELCVRSTLNLFQKSCGGLTQVEIVTNLRRFENMCKYARDMKAIEEAMLAACGSDIIEPSVIDAETLRIDVISAPTRGSLDFCERVSVPGVSRMNLKSYAKAYRLLFDSYDMDPRHLQRIQICIHRNSSRGLCQCKEDDWKPIQMNLHDSILSPYEQVYIDVKFTGGISGSVTITLVEVSQGHWRYQFLVSGIGLLFLAPILGQAILGENIYNGVDQFIRWTVRIFAVTFIFYSSIDTLLALVSIGSALTVYKMMSYVVSFGA